MRTPPPSSIRLEFLRWRLRCGVLLIRGSAFPFILLFLQVPPLGLLIASPGMPEGTFFSPPPSIIEHGWVAIE